MGATAAGGPNGSPCARAIWRSIPDEVSFETASTLPVAGLTALGVLAFGGSARGAVASRSPERRAGSAGSPSSSRTRRAPEVTAVVGSPERERGASASSGPTRWWSALEPEGPAFDLILESAGGSSLAAALGRVSPDGTVVTFGNSSNEPTTFDARAFYRRGRPTMKGYFVTHELLEGRLGTAELAELAGLVASGRLRVEIDLVVPWTEAASAVTALLERRVRGKAVLTVGSS